MPPEPAAIAATESLSETAGAVASALAATPVDVVVVGAGIIGLGIAWAVARSGRTVCVIDPQPASGATYAAAGMLAPVSELHYQEEQLLELMMASAALYPDFIESLGGAETRESGEASGYQRTRTIVVGADAADRQALSDLRMVQQSHGLAVTPLTTREVRMLEPLLSPQLSGAFQIDDDHQVDPRWLARELQRALTEWARDRRWAHEVFVTQTVAGLLRSAAGDVVGVTLQGDDGMDGSDNPNSGGATAAPTVTAREVIIANGLQSAGLDGLPAGLRLPLRPVHGDILRLNVPAHLRPLVTATVRGVVHGVPVYIVPRVDGSVVIGATAREDGSAAVSAGGVYQLLRDAQVLMPAVAELELVEVLARARPATPDNAPLLGRVADAASGLPIAGLIIATGFFRHGVLLMPIAAQICIGLLDGESDPRWAAFAPDRFSAPPLNFLSPATRSKESHHA